ncbi:hypothetical protein [Synechococcus sp. PCC 7336]|uniref:hypothetical protein n=1 Tax=Synechococcus sp. PCC 7336 TaxID=195250 RepID=UPI0003448EC2|nr:hypothetical protein [Synechococcus sp. PCC 7336]
MGFDDYPNGSLFEKSLEKIRACYNRDTKLRVKPIFEQAEEEASQGNSDIADLLAILASQIHHEFYQLRLARENDLYHSYIQHMGGIQA